MSRSSEAFPAGLLAASSMISPYPVKQILPVQFAGIVPEPLEGLRAVCIALTSIAVAVKADDPGSLLSDYLWCFNDEFKLELLVYIFTSIFLCFHCIPPSHHHWY